MSFARRRSVRSKCSTGFAGSRRTGSPSVRIGNSIGALSTDAVRLRRARRPPRRPTAASRPRRPGTRSGSSASKHTVRPPSDVTSNVIGSWAASLALERSSVPTTRNTGAPDREPGCRAPRTLVVHGTGPGCRGPTPGPRDRRGARSGRSPIPDGRAQPDRLHPDRERVLAGGQPGPGGRQVHVEDRDEVESRRHRGRAPTSGPPTRTSPAAAGSRGRSAAANGHRRCTARPTPPPAPPRRDGPRTYDPPQVAHRPGASQTTHRISPSRTQQRSAAGRARGRRAARRGTPAPPRSREAART